MGFDEKIIEGCKAGNRKAQKILFEKLKSPMFGICMRYSKTKDEAEDVLMEAFMNIFSEVGSYRGDGSFEQWARRIVVNTAINNYRKNLKHYFHSDVDNIDETQIDMDENFQMSEDLSAKDVIKAMQELPEGYRIVFNLYVMEGYKHKEIADMLDITVGTSKSQLSKARKIIQEKLLN